MKKIRYLKSVFRIFLPFFLGIKCFHTIMYIIKCYKTSHPLGCKQQNVYWILFHSLWGIVLTNYFGSIANIGQIFSSKEAKFLLKNNSFGIPHLHLVNYKVSCYSTGPIQYFMRNFADKMKKLASSHTQHSSITWQCYT